MVKEWNKNEHERVMVVKVTLNNIETMNVRNNLLVRVSRLTFSTIQEMSTLRVENFTGRIEFLPLFCEIKRFLK